MPLSPGDKLGPYEILVPLGAGGMGEVYRARDTRLDRTVAIKTSKTEFSERFAREARAVAALNHPNICQLYDLGTLPEGGSYLVMEFVDGSPIAPVDSPRRLLDLVVQIADGMAAAHSAGFMHRDLKPDNILITGPQTPHPGRVKILDFGLAKQDASIPQTEATRTIAAVTNPGTVMGSVPYMSPEQARGEGVDARSDQFSFGLIVYELIRRKRAFARPSAAETMAAIIRDEAEPLPPSVPAPLRWVVERCLAKDPAERYDSTKDLYRELKYAREHLAESSVSGPQAASTSVRARRRAWGIAALAALALVLITVAGDRLLWQTPQPPTWTSVTLGGPEMALDSRLSPDGSLLAFQAMDRGLTQVAVMKPETGNWSILTHKRDRGVIFSVAWSRHGTSLYYDRRTDIPLGVFSVPVLGGDERLVLENAAYPEPLPDGSLLVARINPERKPQLFRFWPDSGRLQDLPVSFRSISESANNVRLVPNGKQAVVNGARLGREDQGWGLLVVDLETGATWPLLPALAPEIALKGFAVTHDGRSVLAALPAGLLARIVSIPINGPTSVRTTPQTLFTVANGVWYLDSAQDGSVYMSLTDRPVELVRRPLGGGRSEQIASFPHEPSFISSAVLPDGRAVVAAGSSGRARLVMVEKGKDPVPLTSAAEETSAPVTVAGPREIAFVVGPAPHQTIAIANTANGRITRRIPLNKGDITSLASSPDGQTLYCAAGGAIWAVPVPASGSGTPRMVRAGESVVADPSGRQLVIGVQESSRFRLFRVPVEGGSEKEIVLGGSIPLAANFVSPNALSADGRLLHPLQLRDSWFWPPGLIDTGTGQVIRLPADDVSDYFSMAWLSDGRIWRCTSACGPRFGNFSRGGSGCCQGSDKIKLQQTLVSATPRLTSALS